MSPWSLLLAVALVAAPARPVQDAAQRDPRGLPAAEPGQWKGWKPDDPLPEGVAAWISEGTRAYLDRDYGAALGLYYRVLDSEPDFPAGLYQLGVVYFRLRRYGDCVRG